MIAFVRGQVAAVTLDQRRPRGRRRRPRADVHARHARHAAHRARPATLPTSMVVREDSLTLFGFLDEDEKPMLRARADRLRRRPQAGPGDARRARARRPARRRRRRRRQDPDPGARHRPEGRPADHPRAQGPARRPDRRAAGRHAPAARRRAWRDQVHQGLVGLGWSAKEADDAVEAVAPEAGDAPDVAALLRAALRTLSKA